MSETLEIVLGLTLSVIAIIAYATGSWVRRIGVIGAGIAASASWALFGHEDGGWIIAALLIGALARELDRRPHDQGHRDV